MHKNEYYCYKWLLKNILRVFFKFFFSFGGGGGGASSIFVG